MKPIPQALYSCEICRVECSWPAADLFWHEENREWICRECWDDETHGPHGVSLADEIENQKEAK